MNLSIIQRLLVLCGVSILSLVLVALAGFFAARAPEQSLDVVRTQVQPSIALVEDIERSFLNMRRLLAIHVIELYDAKKQEDLALIKAEGKALDAAFDRYTRFESFGDHERGLLDTIRREIASYDGVRDEILAKSNEYDTDGARELLVGKGAEIGNKVGAALKALREHNTRQAEEQAQRASSRASFLLGLAWSITAVAVLLSLGLATVLIRSVRRSLRAVQGTVASIEGELDFTRRVPVTQKDELGQIALAINRLIERLQGNLATLADSSRALAASAVQMTGSADRAAHTSAQQSESASSMAATVEQITVTISHVAERAQEANERSSMSSQLAANGELVIGQTVSDINEIAQVVQRSSARIVELERQGDRIAGVVAVIKEVADQTNLLALNAAIEAARAGEAGRGFAVVADEVRKLAERTSQSTREISATIDAMRSSAEEAVACMNEAVSCVATGVSGAEETNQAIQQIRSGSQDAVQLVEEIAGSIREQGAATTSLAGQVEQIARMSEAASAVAAESAESARGLATLAREMRGVVEAYRV